MTPTDKSPREWTMTPLVHELVPLGALIEGPSFIRGEKVIEKSAYLAMKQELDAARARFDEANLNASKVMMDQHRQLAEANKKIEILREGLHSIANDKLDVDKYGLNEKGYRVLASETLNKADEIGGEK